MKKEILALTVIGLVIVSASAGYLAGTSTNRSATTTATPITFPSSVCTIPIAPINATGVTELYEINTWSIGVICVRYEFQGNGSYSFSPTDYGTQVGSRDSSWIACGAKSVTTVVADCSGLSITPSQPSIDHPTTQNITVAYTVLAQTLVPSLFWFFIGSCDAIPLAIGFKGSGGFVSPPGFGCVKSLGAPTSITVTGTWNINVTEVSTSPPH